MRTLVLLFIFTILCAPGIPRAESLLPPLTVKQQKITEAFQGEFEEPRQGEFLTEEHELPETIIREGHIPRRKPAAITKQEKDKRSALEKMYEQRADQKLEQFGYDLFGVPSDETQAQLSRINKDKPAMPMGAVQDDFILNAGDEIEVVFTGQRADRGNYKISSEGLLIIEDLPPIPAGGRSIGQVRLSVQAAASNLHNTKAYVSLSSVRQISVLVAGHAKRPGRQTMTVFHTILDALMEAGGVQKTGSLRQIKLVRNGRSTIIDLYTLLLYGGSNIDLNLRDGDRIIIPAIGPTVSVAGEAKRPGIFEILPEVNGMHHKPEKRAQKLSLNEMLELGRGVLSPGKNRYMKLAITSKGTEKLNEVNEPFKPIFGDGSILMIYKGQEKRTDRVELKGHTRRPGMHALDKNPTLAKLISSERVLGPDVYPLIGVIERRDPE